MLFFGVLVCFIIAQRIGELFISQKNEKILKSLGSVEYDRRGYKVIVAMHVCFILSLIAEKIFAQRSLNPYWTFLAAAFVCAQILRYWSIFSLGVRWNTKLITIPGSPLVKRGPYKFLNHPNYIAVIIEIGSVPLLFSCYITFTFFSILNLIFLLRRIKIEENILNL